MRHLIRVALICALGVPLLMGISGCGGSDGALAQQQSDAVKQRVQTYARAQAEVPAPNVTSFPLRKTLAEMTVRQSLENHPWYIYIIGQNGNTIGYYVGKTVPINACDFLSSTENINDPNGDGNIITSAPSLDGIYYGGSGSSSGCDAWVFLDQSTNALIQIRGVDFFSSDKPLALNADPIRVSG